MTPWWKDYFNNLGWLLFGLVGIGLIGLFIFGALKRVDALYGNGAAIAVILVSFAVTLILLVAAVFTDSDK